MSNPFLNPKNEQVNLSNGQAVIDVGQITISSLTENKPVKSLNGTLINGDILAASEIDFGGIIDMSNSTQVEVPTVASANNSNDAASTSFVHTLVDGTLGGNMSFSGTGGVGYHVVSSSLDSLTYAKSALFENVSHFDVGGKNITTVANLQCDSVSTAIGITSTDFSIGKSSTLDASILQMNYIAQYTQLSSGLLTFDEGSLFTNNIKITGMEISTDQSTTKYENQNITDTISLNITTPDVYASGNITAASFIKTGGTSSEFLKADGSVDNSRIYVVDTNVAIGTNSLISNTSGIYNAAIGQDALKLNITGNYNTALGGACLLNNIEGSNNLAIGVSALQSNTTGLRNVAVGVVGLLENTHGSDNVAIGENALRGNTLGGGNTALGVQGLKTNTTGNYNTTIGFQADVIGNNLTNAMAIGYNAKVGSSNTIQLGSINVTMINTSAQITAGGFIKTGGTNQQYLMADGSVLQASGSSGNSNIYLYNNHSGVLTPPPTSGDIGYNNTVQDSATIVYISHLTRDGIDVEVFYQSINSLYDLYIQDQSTSVNFIRYNITGSITLVPNSYIAVPVLKIDSGGTGASSFGSGHNVILSFISNLAEVDTRLTAVETKTQNQTAVSGITTFTGDLVGGAFKVSGQTGFLKADGNIDNNSYLQLTGGALTGQVSTNQTPTLSTQLVPKSYVDTTVGNYLLKSGGTMTGSINMGATQITNASKISTISGTFNIGFNNTNNYTSTDLNILCGNSNIINANENIIFGVSNSITSNQTNVVGRGNTNINTGLGNVFGFFNSVISTSANVIGYNNNVGGTTAGYYSNCIGVNNILNGLYASGIGSDITNNTPNSLCLGDNAISTIFPNSAVCDLGTSAKPYKDIYYSGEIKATGISKLDLQSINSFFIGIMFQNGSGLLTNISNSLWTAAGSSSSAASSYAVTNNFTRQLCCALWTTTALADGAQCGYVSTSLTGIQVSMGFQFGLLSALGIADSTYNANNCQNFWGLWNVATTIVLNQATQLSVQRNMICFGSNTTDANICIYTAGALSTVKQVDLGANFPANRPSGALSTNFYRFSFYWDGTKIYYKAINTTSNITVQGSFTPLSTDIPVSTISLYPQCVRVMGTPQSNGQARLQVQRFGVFY